MHTKYGRGSVIHAQPPCRVRGHALSAFPGSSSKALVPRKSNLESWIPLIISAVRRCKAHLQPASKCMLLSGGPGLTEGPCARGTAPRHALFQARSALCRGHRCKCIGAQQADHLPEQPSQAPRTAPEQRHSAAWRLPLQRRQLLATAGVPLPPPRHCNPLSHSSTLSLQRSQVPV